MDVYGGKTVNKLEEPKVGRRVASRFMEAAREDLKWVSRCEKGRVQRGESLGT